MAYTFHGTSTPAIPANLIGNTTEAKMKLGTIVYDTNGNSYRYIQASEAIAIGQAVTPVALTAWDSGILQDGAGSAGDTMIHVDTITTAKAASFYAGYWVSQPAAAGLGLAYQIKSHPAFAASGESDVFLEGALEETIANNAALDIYHPYLMELVDADTEIIRGIAINTIDADSYGFVQVGGVCRGVAVGHSTSEAVTVNENLVPIAANAGSLQGRDGILEADLLEVAASTIIALDTVAANTAGYVAALIQGQL